MVVKSSSFDTRRASSSTFAGLGGTSRIGGGDKTENITYANSSEDDGATLTKSQHQICENMLVVLPQLVEAFGPGFKFDVYWNNLCRVLLRDSASNAFNLYFAYEQLTG
ncbi:unnamed protein product [Amoebophrya sp. A25]|nr:unnamed protein product [Amoebophrya sp. A25]|eukprot:GSA25T00015819001.1